MFYTWDFRPGSRLILAWKNALGPDVFIPYANGRKYNQNFNEVFRNPHSNEFSLRFIYFIDYNDVKKK